MKSLRSDIKNNLRLESKKNSNLKLINSTIKSISKRGINDTTMSNVSQGAGLSQGLINFHFTFLHHFIKIFKKGIEAESPCLLKV